MFFYSLWQWGVKSTTDGLFRSREGDHPSDQCEVHWEGVVPRRMPSKGQDSHACKHGQDAGVSCDYLPEPEADIAVVGTHTCGLRAGAERRSKRIVGGYKSLR